VRVSHRQLINSKNTLNHKIEGVFLCLKEAKKKKNLHITHEKSPNVLLGLFYIHGLDPTPVKSHVLMGKLIIIVLGLGNVLFPVKHRIGHHYTIQKPIYTLFIVGFSVQRDVND
jgi:hypothetical protein